MQSRDSLPELRLLFSVNREILYECHYQPHTQHHGLHPANKREEGEGKVAVETTNKGKGCPQDFILSSGIKTTSLLEP